MIQPLQAPDSLHLRAAEGWIGLGDYATASEELELISETSRAHPEVFQLRWRIYAQANNWDACLEIATALTIMRAEGLFGWIHRATSLHRLGRTQEAKDLLVSVVNRFESNPTIPFHLARYCCALGQLDEALRWLETAVANANRPMELIRLREKLVEDAALEPLRKMSSGFPGHSRT